MFLGISFASSIPVVYAIFASSFSITMYWLFFATVCWVISYDTFYALNDWEDDKHLPIYSLPKTLGEKNSKLFAQFLLMIAEIIMIGLIDYSKINILLVFLSIFLVTYIIYDAQKNRINNLDLFHLNGLLGFLWCIINFNY
jgi:4-hydroxybenzoate polyprenyltransferase